MERTGSVLGLNRGFVAAAQIKRLFSTTPSSSAKKRNGAKISREGMVYDFWRGTSAWRMPGDGQRAEKEEGVKEGGEVEAQSGQERRLAAVAELRRPISGIWLTFNERWQTF